VEQRISIVTLGVRDLARARRFYDDLGWRGQEAEETVFYQAGGLALILWGRDKLAEDAGVDDVDAAASFGGIVLAHNVRSAADVDRIVARAAASGATITRAPSPTFYGGYAGCFRDPDGHVWEVAFNPGFPLDDDGNLTLPDLAT
jgi:catechol 2,3-dioxygenase-like lactoylglutathione lyase family enzyme